MDKYWYLHDREAMQAWVDTQNTFADVEEYRITPEAGKQHFLEQAASFTRNDERSQRISQGYLLYAQFCDEVVRQRELARQLREHRQPQVNCSEKGEDTAHAETSE